MKIATVFDSDPQELEVVTSSQEDTRQIAAVEASKDVKNSSGINVQEVSVEVATGLMNSKELGIHQSLPASKPQSDEQDNLTLKQDETGVSNVAASEDITTKQTESEVVPTTTNTGVSDAQAPAYTTKNSREASEDIITHDADVANKEMARPLLEKPNFDGASDIKPANNIVPAKRGHPARVAPTPAKRLKADAWSAENILQKPKSKIVGVNLKKLFNDDEAWNCLDLETQQRLANLLPEARRGKMVKEVDGQLVMEKHAVMANNSWGYYLSCAKDDISTGKHNPKWFQDANNAHAKRKKGQYDNWKDKEYEAFWGIKQKLAVGVIAGDSVSVRWEDLINMGKFKVGDVFKYERNIGGVNIRKDVHLLEIITTGKKPLLKLRYARGLAVTPKGNDEDLICDDIVSPEAMNKGAIAAQGTLKGAHIPNGNSWKVIRLERRNQDLGTLWDIRQAVHFAQAEAEPQDKKKGRNARSEKRQAAMDVTDDEGDDDYGEAVKKKGGRKASTRKASVQKKKAIVDVNDEDEEMEDVVAKPKGRAGRPNTKKMMEDEDDEEIVMEAVNRARDKRPQIEEMESELSESECNDGEGFLEWKEKQTPTPLSTGKYARATRNGREL